MPAEICVRCNKPVQGPGRYVVEGVIYCFTCGGHRYGGYIRELQRRGKRCSTSSCKR